MKKQILILAMAVLMIGLVSAGDRTLYETTDIDIPSDIVAGNTFGANFSFKYLDDFSNPDNSPLIIQLNFTSDDESYPVWRGDFEVSGRVEKYALWGFIHVGTVYFECNNSETQIIDHPLDSQTVWADNGTFYCYNSAGDLQLEEHDEVYFDMVSNYALYPGQYGLSASMFYLTDGKAPFVNITNKGLFDKYYRENDNVLVLATIDDVSGISEKWASVTLAGTEIFPVNYDHFENDEYYFSRNTPVDIVEDDYELFVFAEDNYGNRGNDSVILKIDRTGPIITLIEPSGGIYDEMIPVELQVEDAKSGVNNQSVYYRISEIVNGTFCPSTGIILGNFSCYNSGWLPATYNSTTTNYHDEFNSALIESGEYWFEAKAEDILGNQGEL